jgi:hypothetical protein
MAQACVITMPTRTHDLALEFCTQTFHPLTDFSLYPFIGVERAVEPVNVLNTLSSKPDPNTPASSGSRRHDRKRNAVIFSNHRKVSNPLDWWDLSMLIHELDKRTVRVARTGSEESSAILMAAQPKGAVGTYQRCQDHHSDHRRHCFSLQDAS